MRRSLSAVCVGVLLAGVAVAAGPAGASDGGGLLRPSDAVVQPTRPGRTVALAPGAACQTLLTRPGGQCGVVAGPGGGLLFTIEAGPSASGDLASRPFTVTIYRSLGSGRWVSTLQTRPTAGQAGPLFVTVTARTARLTGHAPTLLLGYRSEGTGAFLAVDFVAATARGPRVAGHLLLDQGMVVIQPGQLVTYSSVYRPRDANCCPSFLERTVVRARGASFVAESARQLPTRQVRLPVSDLG